jgi:tetratricopeptide (TPR) repeat protein/predicted Ser/Thr protein kinase
MAGTTAQIRAGVVIAGRYRVIDRLGHGGMATVFLAEDMVLSRQVAVKRMHTAAGEESAERFKREAQLGAALNHPNIVSVYDTVSGPDGVLIVMEYVPGRPLSELIAAGSADPAEAIRILRDVARGLDYAHLRGVVHRDVKPANILVRDDGVVKLSDLGVATAAHVSRITATHDVLGTLGYIAPERLDGEAGGPPADVYALAAVAFQALSGERPHLGATPAEALRRSAADPPPDLREAWPGAPAAAAAILGRGLDPDPDRRPLSAGRLIEELEAGLEASGTAAAAQSPAATAARDRAGPVKISRSSGSRVRAMLVGALLAVAAGVVALVLAAGDGDAPTTAGREADAGPGTGDSARPGEGTKTSTTTTTTTVAQAPPKPDGSLSGAALNEQGFALIEQGRYDEAAAVLRHAVDSFPAGTSDLNYAYALYNLGHALRLAGRPEEAIPILEQRLEIPNQVETVERELAAARAAAGGGKEPKEPKQPKHEK